MDAWAWGSWAIESPGAGRSMPRASPEAWMGLMGHREPWGWEERAQGKSRGAETPGLGVSLSLRAGAHTSDCGVTPNPSPSLNLSLFSFINWVGWISDMVTSWCFLI